MSEFLANVWIQSQIWAQPSTGPAHPAQSPLRPKIFTASTPRPNHALSTQTRPPSAPRCHSLLSSTTTTPRRPPPPSPAAAARHILPSWSAAPNPLGRGGGSEEDGVEGCGEAHQALEDPPRWQRNLSRSLPPLRPPVPLVSPTFFSLLDPPFPLVFHCQVMIIRGKDKGETGLIKRVIRSQNRVIVEGKNLVICRCMFYPGYLARVWNQCSR